MGKVKSLAFGALCAAITGLAALPVRADPITGCNFPAAAGLTSLNPIGCLVYSTNGPVRYNGVKAGTDTYDITLNSFDFYQTGPGKNEAILTGSYVDTTTHSASINFSDMAPLTGAVSVIGTPSLGTVFNFDVTSLLVTGGDLGADGFIRLDPADSSGGHADVIDNGDGTYNIDDFFKLFTEISLDDGVTVIPASGDLELAIRDIPEAGTLALFCAGLMGLGLIMRRRAAGSGL